MNKIMLMSLVALVVMTMTSCNVRIGDKGFGFDNHENNTPTQVHQVDQPTSMNRFDEVGVAGPFNVIYNQGEGYTVLVKGTTEQLSKMTIYVEGNSLVIDQRRDEPSGTFDGLQVFVTAPVVDCLSIAGSGKLTAPKALDFNDLRLEVAGSGDITLGQLTCKDLGNEIAGSGDITLGIVQANKVTNEIAGSGDIDIAGLTCKDVNNEIAGSGNITLNNLNVENVKSEIAGSGDIILRGKVANHNEDIAGSGKVHINE